MGNLWQEDVLQNLFSSITDHIATSENIAEVFFCSGLSHDQENGPLGETGAGAT